MYQVYCNVFPIPVLQLSQQTENIGILLLFSILGKDTEAYRLKNMPEVTQLMSREESTFLFSLTCE